MVHGRQMRRVFELLTLFTSIHHVATQQLSMSDNPDLTPYTAGVSSAQPGPNTALLDRIGRLISSIFPSEGLDLEREGGLFGGDGSSLGWGGSTLEVVVSRRCVTMTPLHIV